jgi:phosphohistidine phosphatase
MRTLVLMRHAAAGNAPGKTDRDRPLRAEGRQEAEAAGAWLRAAGVAPDKVLCSTAVRARETVARLGLDGVPVEVEHDLYLAPADAILDRVAVEGDAPTLLVVGHNPGLQQALLLLVAATAPSDAESRFPTAATVVLDVDVPLWSALRTGDVRVRKRFRP